MMSAAGVTIRDARPDDAAACAEVMRNSIRELCVLDHGNREDVLNGWLANKTPENVGGWIADENAIFLVAERHGHIVAVGSARLAGEITLNYVAPSARLEGIGAAILTELEMKLASTGCNRAWLTSTNTALGFYRRLGYTADGPPKPWQGDTEVHPMAKAL
ncbi:GNAT family N-acetyltransferase [Pelagibacterium xiamenense]|uniref:GNAT family N-acetyltransferase n=1 Tax=Pelagibacterium xiamenense TaxID=2901140 RepID=UPI001E472502|nr:GNAT family N-acetyltransferase [Pelagibacterium xiamenense]MCD7061329.1 GNAT family N-acetyltransferase [Pelagibacterium xiamenense]